MSEPSQDREHEPAWGRQAEEPEPVVLPAMPSLGRLYARAGLDLVAAGPGRLLARGPGPGRPPEGRDRRRGGSGRRLELPQVQIVVPEVSVEPGAHEEFCRVVGAPLRSRPDGTVEAFGGYLHALAFPVTMALLTRADFPLPVVGMVHLANSVRQVRPVAVGEHLSVTVESRDLRDHRAGAAFDVVVELRGEADGQPAWTGTSTYLARGVRLPTVSSGPDASSAPDGAARPDFEAPEPTGRWSLPGDTGRRYARVSGDVNPLHLSAASARALGMKAAIAHGMFTACRALAALEAPAPLEWDVEFGVPLVLPARPAVAVRRTGRGDGFVSGSVTVWDPKRDRPHAVVTARRLPQPLGAS